MQAYKITRDDFRFQKLDLEVNDIIDFSPAEIDYGQAHDFSLDNLSLSQFWRPMKTGFSPIEEVIGTDLLSHFAFTDNGENDGAYLLSTLTPFCFSAIRRQMKLSRIEAKLQDAYKAIVGD